MTKKGMYDPRYYANNKTVITAKRKARIAADPEAYRQAQRERRKTHPQVYRRAWLQYAYGISPTQWESLLKKQGGACAICKSSDPGSKKGWHTDHCAKTNRVRGLLCRSCNTGLGKFKHDYVLMRAAASYLRLNSGE